MKSFRALCIGLLTLFLPMIAAPSAYSQSAELPADRGINPVYNDVSCVPSPAHPNPVVHIHGTGSDSNSFVNVAHFLREQGFCLWTIHYGADANTVRNLLPGHRALGPIEDSVDEIAGFVDEVLATTGARQVDLVGYSQGGTLTKAYIQGRNAAPRVGRSVTLGATFRGTTASGYVEYAGSALDTVPEVVDYLLGASSPQQLAGSDFISWLTQLPDTTPGVIYTALYSSSDTVATPNTTSMLTPTGGADVANVNLQEVCGRPVTHFDLPHTTETAHLVHWGLTRAPGNTVPTRENCGV